MRKFVRHPGRSRDLRLFDHPRLLLLLFEAHRRKVGEHGHQPCVILVKGLGSAMGHDKDRTAGVFGSPRKQDAVRYQRRLDAEDLEKFLRDSEVLRVSTL